VHLGLVAHLLLDVEVRVDVLVELGAREGVLDDADFGPLVLLGREDFGDFFFVVGPLCQLATLGLVS
jgi:hypothetical protein